MCSLVRRLHCQPAIGQSSPGNPPAEPAPVVPAPVPRPCSIRGLLHQSPALHGASRQACRRRARHRHALPVCQLQVCCRAWGRGGACGRLPCMRLPCGCMFVTLWCTPTKTCPTACPPSSACPPAHVPPCPQVPRHPRQPAPCGLWPRLRHPPGVPLQPHHLPQLHRRDSGLGELAAAPGAIGQRADPRNTNREAAMQQGKALCSAGRHAAVTMQSCWAGHALLRCCCRRACCYGDGGWLVVFPCPPHPHPPRCLRRPHCNRSASALPPRPPQPRFSPLWVPRRWRSGRQPSTAV